MSEVSGFGMAGLPTLRRDLFLVPHRLRVFHLFGGNIAPRRYDLAPEPSAHDVVHALSEARITVHQGVEFVRLQHQEAGARHRDHVRRAARPAQDGDLAKEVPLPEPHALMRELDLDLALGDEYIELATSPRRAIKPPGSTCWARSSRMMLPISPASSSENSGTRATIPQVTTKSRRWISSANPLAMMPTGSATMIRPMKIVTPAMSLPTAVTGTTSP